MAFEELLESRAIARVSASPREIADLLALARRDVATSQTLTATDLDWAFNVAYNAILQTSVAYMYSRGYRPRGAGKHHNTFAFMDRALPEQRTTIRRLQRLRKKRNATVYEQVGLISETEAHDIIEFAGDYYRQMVALMPPELIGRPSEGDSPYSD
jgi:glutamine synthetase type III